MKIEVTVDVPPPPYPKKYVITCTEDEYAILKQVASRIGGPYAESDHSRLSIDYTGLTLARTRAEQARDFLRRLGGDQ